MSDDRADFEEPGLQVPQTRPSFISLRLTNFLSYREATLSFAPFVALVGPNASGKSNAVSAIKLLREIPYQGLPTALARRGGFDQLRHRSGGRPHNPAFRLDFRFEGENPSYYELRLGSVAGKRYKISMEKAQVYANGDSFSFENIGGRLQWSDTVGDSTYASSERGARVAPGQSAVTASASYAGYLVGIALESMQTVEINPARVGELQEPSSVREFEPDGSNTASVFESLSMSARRELVDQLSAIVPGISGIEPRRLGDRMTLEFSQKTASGTRQFLAKQMSDGTLRAFGILLAALQPTRPALLAIEEPEIAIHLGALETLVEILTNQSESAQVLITTHSADIVDKLGVDQLRVIWSTGTESHIGNVAEHTKKIVRDGLISPGKLLRADSLDPAV